MCQYYMGIGQLALEQQAPMSAVPNMPVVDVPGPACLLPHFRPPSPGVVRSSGEQPLATKGTDR